MLKRDIKYTDFNGQEQVEPFYFNLSTSEVYELALEPDEGLDKWLEEIIATDNRRELFATFKKIILSSYGIKSEDGKSFEKSPELSHEFSFTAAFDALILDLTTNEQSAADFIRGIVPTEVAAQAEALEAQKAEEAKLAIAAAQRAADANKAS